MLAKDANPEKYNISLDQFSLDILQGTHDIAKQFVGQPAKNLHRNILQEADQAVWQSKGMGEYFPGNIQFRDINYHSNSELAKKLYGSQGTTNSLQMGAEFNLPGSVIHNIGRRPAELMLDKEKYEQVDGERFVSIINKETGKIDLFWDKKIHLNEQESPTLIDPIFNQINNTPRLKSGNMEEHENTTIEPNNWDYNSGKAIRNYLQANNEYIAPESEVKSKQEFIKSAPQESAILDIIREEVADEDLVLWIKQ